MPVPKGFREKPGTIATSACDRRSFRVKIVSPRTRLITCCPRNQWDNKRKRCKVGTRAAKIQKRMSGRAKMAGRAKK